MTLTTKLAAAMIALVAIAVSATGWLSYLSIERAFLPRVLDRIETHSYLVASNLAAYASGARGDIAAFPSAAALTGLIRAHVNGGIDPVDGLSEKTWRERISERLAAEVAAKPAYSLLRIIGVDGDQREIVRVDRSGPNGVVRVVPDAELQKRGSRSYFQQTIQLRPGEIYVSPVNLRGENGTIRIPHSLTLRVATPLFAPDGRLFGIIIVNVDMGPALDQARASHGQGERIYVVNDQGDYLLHPDKAREFGSQLGKSARWQDDFPDFASLTGKQRGLARIFSDSTGHPGGVALAPAILAGSDWVGVIEELPNATFMASAKAIENTSLFVGIIAVLSAAALAVMIARSLTRPIVQLTAAVEGSANAHSVRIPVEAGGETGVLARAFERVMGEVHAKTAALEKEVQEHRRTEAARDRYAEREQLFSAAVESSNDAIITKSLDGTVTGWNPAAERLFGFSAEEAVGRRIDLIIPRSRSDEMRDILQKISKGDRIEHHETVRIRKDGSPVEVSLSISPIRAPNGEIVGASKTARDITESKRTQQALNQQIEERRRIFETSQDLILVTDSRGVLVQVSPSSETILGYSPDEMIGRSGSDFIHSDDIESTREQMRTARQDGHTRNFDSRYPHRDGRIVTLSWVATWSAPVRRHFFVGRDMTESRLAQEALREGEQLARGIIDTALDAFVQFDESGAILNWNLQAEKIFGWPRKEALGKNFIELIVSEVENDSLKVTIGQALRPNSSQTLGRRREIVARRRDGKEFKAELSITALKQRERFIFNGFFRDLTDKIAAEERIRQAEKMEAIGQLTGGVAHDFNNILTVITGTIEILAEAVEDDPQLATIARMIDEAAGRGADLTQHLLAFARKQPLRPRETDINKLIIDTAKLLRPTLGEQVEIESIFANEVCVVNVDPSQLTTALLNLALNARDAMPDGGKLILETGGVYLDESYASAHADLQPGRYALIAVSDTGSGIPAAIIDKVFDPFFTSKGPGKGTGLGLSMVYGFVKQSAGHIKIYSEEGHGTTIRMYLPPGTGALVADEADSTPSIEGGHETILVVEDDKLVRDYVLTQLHALGYLTLSAANAAEALAVVESGRAFDLLFTDVIMPGAMNGRQLADDIRKRHPDLKVLFTSGYTENAIIHHGRLDTGVLLLAKPYRKSEMAGMIRKALAG